MTYLAPLMGGMEAVVAEIDVHTDCLTQELEPHHRENIRLNLAGGCARGLTLVAMHRQRLNVQMDWMVPMV